MAESNQSLDDLIERMTSAAADLDRMAVLRYEDHDHSAHAHAPALAQERLADFHRLKGKAEGMRLALSYVQDGLRVAGGAR